MSSPLPQVPPLSDPRIGLPTEMVKTFNELGYDTASLLAIMMRVPHIIRPVFVKAGLDFEEMLRRIKAIVPQELIDEIEGL